MNTDKNRFKINQKSFDNAKTFCEFVKLQDKMSFFGLCRKLGKSYGTLSIWKKGKHVPWLINWLELYLRLGKPKDGYVWLPLSLDFRINTSQAIEVPTKIEKWEAIANVIEKLVSIEDSQTVMPLGKEECFAFALGMMVGDVSKRAGRRDRLDLQLTTRSKTNLKLGNFFCDGLKRLGIRAYRTKDSRWFYRWVSQVSPFFNWVYKVVLGLREDETTTYNAIRVDWFLDAPREIIKRFLQCVYESDVCVSIGGRTIGCAVHPNAYLIQALLNKFGIKSSISNGKYRQVLIFGKWQFMKANGILFAPEIKTERYMLLNMLNTAKRLKPGKKLPLELKKEIMQMKLKGYNGALIIIELIRKYNLNISKEAISRIKPF